MESINGVEVLAFADAAQWESWLDEHYAVESGVWLKLSRRIPVLRP